MKSIRSVFAAIMIAIGIYSFKIPFWVLMVVMMGWANEPKPMSLPDVLTGILSSSLFMIPALIPTVVLFYIAYRLFAKNEVAETNLHLGD